jgi:hypothetical protein
VIHVSTVTDTRRFLPCDILQVNVGRSTSYCTYLVTTVVVVAAAAAAVVVWIYQYLGIVSVERKPSVIPRQDSRSLEVC